MKKNILVLAISALVVINPSIYAQFGFKKPAPAAPAVTVQATVPTGDLLKLVTLSTDQGMIAMDILASIFPPEKIAAFEESSKKYHELQDNRTNGYIDADQCQASTDAAAEFAKVIADWSSYNKDKAKAISKADHRLSLLILVDGLAALQVPAKVESLQAQVTSLASNPMQFRKVIPIKNSVVLFLMIGKQMPKQVETFRQARGVIKQIAAAENITLAPDPPADSLKDTDGAMSAITTLPPDEPATTAAPAATAPGAQM